MTKAERIGVIVGELHQVLNAYYGIDRNDTQKKKAIRKVMTKLYDMGHDDGFAEAKELYQG